MVMSSLIENVNKTGYNISWSDENENKVYGLAQCRGDLNASACRVCISSATKSIAENCSASISKSIYLSGCFLRYATHNFYSQVNPSDTPSAIRYDDTKEQEQITIARILANLCKDETGRFSQQ